MLTRQEPPTLLARRQEVSSILNVYDRLPSSPSPPPGMARPHAPCVHGRVCVRMIWDRTKTRDEHA